MSVTYGYATPLAARYWGPDGWTDADVRGTVLAACMGEDSHDSAGRKVRYSSDSLAGQRS